MGASEFDELAARLRDAADVVNAYTIESVQLRVIDALLDAFHGTVTPRARPERPEEASAEEPESGGRRRRATKRRNAPPEGDRPAPAKRKGTRGLSVVNDLELTPSGVESFEAFATRAQPKNHSENCLAVIYWFEHVSKQVPVTQDTVFTVYRLMQWTLPADLGNKLSQTGTTGWINPSDRDNLTVTILGLNHVEKTMLKRESPL